MGQKALSLMHKNLVEIHENKDFYKKAVKLLLLYIIIEMKIYKGIS